MFHGHLSKKFLLEPGNVWTVANYELAIRFVLRPKDTGFNILQPLTNALF
jgi:hypothetical protein